MLVPKELYRRLSSYCWINKPWCNLALRRGSLSSQQELFGQVSHRRAWPCSSLLSSEHHALGVREESGDAEQSGGASPYTWSSFPAAQSHPFVTQANLLWGTSVCPLKVTDLLIITWIQYVDDLLLHSPMIVNTQYLLQALVHKGHNISEYKMQSIALKCIWHDIPSKGKTLFLKKLTPL